MIKIMNIEKTEIKDILTRDINLETGVEDIVSGVIKNVKLNGDAALYEYSENLTAPNLTPLRLRPMKLKQHITVRIKTF